MGNDSEKEQEAKKVIHLEEAEHLPRASATHPDHDSPRRPSFARRSRLRGGGSAMAEPGDAGRSHDLPAVSNSYQTAEVVKQIIEQILVNERRRARIEFVRMSVFFLVFLFVILGAGIWFARQLLVQLREERQLTEQTWRMMAGGGDRGLAVYSADKTLMLPDHPNVKIPPVLNREEVAKIEQNISALSELLKTKPQSASASVRDMLQSQQNAIQALRAQINEAQTSMDAASEQTKQVDFIAAPLAKDLNLRMPIPAL